MRNDSRFRGEIGGVTPMLAEFWSEAVGPIGPATWFAREKNPAPERPTGGEAVNPGDGIFPAGLAFRRQRVELVKIFEPDVLGHKHEPGHATQLQRNIDDQPGQAKSADRGRVEFRLMALGQSSGPATLAHQGQRPDVAAETPVR